LFSCKKAFDIKPKSEIDISDNYRNVTDANAAVLGVYGKLMNLAGQYIVLNELRADLMDVTPNADKYLQEISQHHVTVGNPWADPRPFYAVILNCNDVIYNLNLMLAANRISVADYNYRYSDMVALRCWVYLQLGIHFGTVPYVTDPLSNINDLKDQSKFPRLGFQALLNNLVTVTATLPWLEPYPNVITLINGSTTTNPATPATIGGFNFTHNFIDKHLLLADLYLWQAAYNHPENYTLAAGQYRKVIDYLPASPLIPTGSQIGGNNDFAIDYIRYREQDINQLVSTSTQGWRSMFSRPVYPTYDAGLDKEWVWQMFFPQNNAPADPFVDLFSQQGGRYLVQPSQTAINNWNAQVQVEGNGTSGNVNFVTSFYSDARMRLTFSDPTGNYNTFNNQNVIVKNLYVYQDPTISQSNKYGRWFLYRAAAFNLRYAECANRDGFGQLAYAILNSGLNTVFNPYNYSITNPIQTGNGPALPPLSAVQATGLPVVDVTNIQQTFYPAPYDIDARSGQTPFYRNGWYLAAGIRGRANLKSYDTSYWTRMQDQEDLLILESGLELAYEGYRWPDLLRIAIRRNDPSFLANKIGDKLSKDNYGGAAAAQSKLLSGNYYLPFNW